MKIAGCVALVVTCLQTLRAQVCEVVGFGRGEKDCRSTESHSYTESVKMGRSFGEIVIQKASAQHSATVIILHGLGDTGHGWKAAASQIGLGPHVKFIFPTAPTRPITLNMGMPMPGWFDISVLSTVEKMLESMDHEGIQESVDYVKGLIDNEVASGIAPDRIAVAGFSQGGHVALKVALQYPKKLAACVAMSTWLEPFSFEVPAAKDVPFLVCHGMSDPLVPPALASITEKLLKSKGFEVTLKTYEGVAHSASPHELNDITQFLSASIPQSAPRAVSRHQVDSMSVKELKEFLASHNFNMMGLLEKQDLLAAARELCE